MAITTQTINDGSRNTIIKIDGQLTADVTGQTVVTFANLEGKPSAVRVKRIRFDIRDTLGVDLYWGGGTPATLANLSRSGKICADKTALLVNNATTPDGTITLSTTGYSATSNQFTIILELVK